MSDHQANPETPSAKVTLQEITEQTVGAILRLEVADHQKNFVASNAVSIAQAYFSKNAWFRAIYADETPVGFVMLYVDETKPEYVLWRYMIDRQQQGKGYGDTLMNASLAKLGSARRSAWPICVMAAGPRCSFKV